MEILSRYDIYLISTAEFSRGPEAVLGLDLGGLWPGAPVVAARVRELEDAL